MDFSSALIAQWTVGCQGVTGFALLAVTTTLFHPLHVLPPPPLEEEEEEISEEDPIVEPEGEPEPEPEPEGDSDCELIYCSICDKRRRLQQPWAL